jgi:hypothetical protein
MHEVMKRFPTAAELVAATPADLAAAVLQGILGIVGRRETWGNNSPPFLPIANLASSIVNGILDVPQTRAAGAEAITWLFSHDLIAEVYPRGGQGTIVPTRLGYEVAAAASASGMSAPVLALRALELVPATLRMQISSPLVAGSYDVAIITAFKTVEVRMRERAGLSSSDFGSRLARKFFERVTSTALQRKDRKGLVDEVHLFEGLFGMYRDRAVHEAPHVDSLEYALEIIVGAAHLLRIVESATLVDPTGTIAGDR